MLYETLFIVDFEEKLKFWSTVLCSITIYSLQDPKSNVATAMEFHIEPVKFNRIPANYYFFRLNTHFSL